MDMLRTDSAACAALDLTARLHAELTEALARLAITTARTHNILSRGEAAPTDLTNARILQAEQVEVLVHAWETGLAVDEVREESGLEEEDVADLVDDVRVVEAKVVLVGEVGIPLEAIFTGVDIGLIAQLVRAYG